MKLMYVCQRARPDIVTAIAFLCTRVSKSTEEDWDKLKRLLEFLKGTMGDELVLGADKVEDLLTFVDVSFAVHGDMRSHTGGCVSFGRGANETTNSINIIGFSTNTLCLFLCVLESQSMFLE